MWWDEARIRMAANPNKTLEEFNSFMGHFVKKRGKGKPKCNVNTQVTQSAILIILNIITYKFMLLLQINNF